jgi:hypothetical protein
MRDEEKLFKVAALLCLRGGMGAPLPALDKSHVGSARITLRSADGTLLARIPTRQAVSALASGHFGDLRDELPSLINRRAEDNAKIKEERDQAVREVKGQLRSLTLAITDWIAAIMQSKNGTPSGLIRAGAVAAGGVVTVWGINFISLQAPLNSIVSSDSRNAGIKVSASYQWMINPGVLVFSVDETSSASPADVSRILLQYAERLEGRKFGSVLLAQRGRPVFLLKGDYFKQIGEEYGVQNVIYTLRTMPENVYELDGSPAFSSWSGGWIGVLGRQFEDLGDFYRRWLTEKP